MGIEGKAGVGVTLDRVQRLYDEFSPGLLAYACAVLGSVTGAEDVVHQVFLNLLAGAHTINGNPRSYLYRAVRNGCFNAQKSTARQVELDKAVWFEAPPNLATEVLTLQAALEDIPVDQREVIVLRIWSGLTLQEASDLLEIPLNTAASRYRYGLSKLRERMNPPRGSKE